MTSLLYYVPRTDVHLTNLQHSALLLVLSYAKSLHRGLYDIYGCCLQVQVEVDDEGSLELKLVLMMTMSGGGGGSHSPPSTDNIWCAHVNSMNTWRNYWHATR